MKRLIFIGFLLLIMGSVFGQSADFLKPIPDNLFAPSLPGLKEVQKDVWLVRPAISITAVQLNWNKETKQLEASAFNQAGIGVGYQHFIESADGTPYNNYGFNAILLLGATNQEPTTSIALTGSFLGYLNFGGLYCFTTNTPGILTGITLKF